MALRYAATEIEQPAALPLAVDLHAVQATKVASNVADKKLVRATEATPVYLRLLAAQNLIEL